MFGWKNHEKQATLKLQPLEQSLGRGNWPGEKTIFPTGEVSTSMVVGVCNEDGIFGREARRRDDFHEGINVSKKPKLGTEEQTEHTASLLLPLSACLKVAHVPTFMFLNAGMYLCTGSSSASFPS